MRKALAGRVALGFAVAVGIAACASTGPASSPQFQSLVANSLPNGSGGIVVVGQGEWTPNTRGQRNPYSVLLGHHPTIGVIAVTTTGLFLEQWDTAQQRYNVVKRILLSDVAETFVDRYDFAGREIGAGYLVLKNKSDLTYDTFIFTGGRTANREKTEAALTYITSRMARP